MTTAYDRLRQSNKNLRHIFDGHTLLIRSMKDINNFTTEYANIEKEFGDDAGFKLCIHVSTIQEAIRFVNIFYDNRGHFHIWDILISIQDECPNVATIVKFLRYLQKLVKHHVRQDGLYGVTLDYIDTCHDVTHYDYTNPPTFIQDVDEYKTFDLDDDERLNIPLVLKELVEMKKLVKHFDLLDFMASMLPQDLEDKLENLKI